MTDIAAQPRPPLGVGDIIGSTFSIFFGRIAYILPLALIPAFVIELMGYMIVGEAQYTGEVDFGAGPSTAGVGSLLVLNLVGSTLATAFVILAAYDARLGRAGNFGQYIGAVMQSAMPLILCSLIVGLATFVAMLALVVPGIWLYGVWCVVVPAIVVERAGFGGLARSAELTRDYRWPCVGTLILITICMLIVVMVLVFVAGLLIGLAGVAELAGGIVANALGSGFGLGLSGVCVAQIYARLREIKEGASVEQIVEVFS